MITGRLDIYINKKNREWYEQLEAIAHIMKIPLAPMIGQAVEYFVREQQGIPKLIADQKLWDSILKNASKDELIEWNRLISSLNNKIIRTLCPK